MYKLPYFTEEDQGKVISFMKENSFAILTGINEDFPVATHLPLNNDINDAKIFLTGHMMKNTDHHKAFEKNKNVVVIFNGPHCYVSASWFSNPKVASTWNYIDVHAKGKIKFTDEQGTKKIIEDITNKYEGLQSDGAFKNLSQEYVDRLVKAIIGFTIEVESVENVFKLSQNHEPETRESIIKHLNEIGGDNEKQIALEMQQRIDLSKKQR